MPILETVVEYEDKALARLVQGQAEVLGLLNKAVGFLDGRLPEQRPALPKAVPGPGAVVSSQFAFAKKVLVSQEKFAKNVTKAVSPLTGEPRAAARTKKAA